MPVKKIGIIGGRGFVGAELIEILNDHPNLELEFASSSSNAGNAIPGTDLTFIDVQPEDIKQFPQLDGLILALPNGQAAKWVQAVDQAGLDLCILDISADFRFDAGWVYGLPEINRQLLHGARRISNPGCYATAAQLALFPIRDMLAGPANIFGVSGFSGAGATPNPKNDPEHLKDNLIPYSLIDHIHEREISHQLGQPVHFSPHVASFFRGISLTIHLNFSAPINSEALRNKFEEFYQDHPLISVSETIPEVKQVVHSPTARIGGFHVDETGRHGVIIVVLDNLLKGAASQAIQNLELALGTGQSKRN
ncbi:MAG: N-acetyl-gamma-glutamyl-phosphate reductase [Robiginitomaculum sp.]|nr:MAG: N-acetyl-gamma-glutamyl-phosphate reductase [Robiginitomaculum sp.]